MLNRVDCRSLHKLNEILCTAFFFFLLLLLLLFLFRRRQKKKNKDDGKFLIAYSIISRGGMNQNEKDENEIIIFFLLCYHNSASRLSERVIINCCYFNFDVCLCARCAAKTRAKESVLAAVLLLSSLLNEESMLNSHGSNLPYYLDVCLTIHIKWNLK